VLAEFAPPSDSSPSPRPSCPSSLPKFDPQSVSEALCAKARQISEQTGAVSPFMERAIEEGIDFVGGKKDGMSLLPSSRIRSKYTDLIDITVIVGVVGERGL
jgi:protein phosphatase PTC7